MRGFDMGRREIRDCVCSDVTNTVQEESYQSQNPYQVTATLRQTEVSMMCFCKPDRIDNTLTK